jgi:TolB protein
MKKPLPILSIIILLVIISNNQCKKDDQKTDEAIPLDGRGGGVLAYCYSSLSTFTGSIYGVNADGTATTRLVGGGSLDVNHHDYSPDGTKFALVVYYYNPQTQSINTCNTDGTGRVRLTTVSGVLDYDPAWSPDGTKIAFTRAYPDPLDFFKRRHELWVMNADGSNQQYIGIEGYISEWSPDGTKFIYSSNKTGKYQIYTCNIDGTNETRITHSSTDDVNPSYSPDGSKIAFQSSPDGFNTTESVPTSEVNVMNSDGSNRIQLTNNECYDAYPKWSPNGTLISFSSDRDCINKLPPYLMVEVYFMNADGTNVRRVTTSPQNVTAINPVWQPVIY